LLHDRNGFLIELTDDRGRKALGEVSPLPGLDHISLDRCRNDLSGLRQELAGGAFNTDHFELTSPGLGMISLHSALTPQTLFGLECALLSLRLQSDASGLQELIRAPVNGLFIPDSADDQADRQIHSLRQSGTKTVKVKIGRLPVDREIRQILRLADAIGDDLRLRLDGNQSLSASAYSAFFSAIGHLKVEYAEEPLSAGDASFFQAVPWPLALDESLPRYLNPALPDADKVPAEIRTVILKPGLLNGLSGMARFIDSAKKRNIQTVLSSSFNTGVGLAMLTVLSCLTGLSSDVACGFDTLKFLQTDVISNFPSVSAGALTIPRSLLADMHLNRQVLAREDI